MKSLKTLIILALVAIPSLTFAQQHERIHEEHSRVKTSTSKKAPKKDSSDVTAILKDSSNAETGPILNDNGNVNSSGSVDGSRSATGRPVEDSVETFHMKKSKISAQDPPKRTDNSKKSKP